MKPTIRVELWTYYDKRDTEIGHSVEIFFEWLFISKVMRFGNLTDEDRKDQNSVRCEYLRRIF